MSQLLSKEIDPNLFKIGAPKVVGKVRFAPVYYNGQLFKWQLPTMYSPFAASSYADDEKGPSSPLSMNLNVRLDPTKPDSPMHKFLDVMNKLSNKIIDYGVERSDELFGEEWSRELVAKSFNKSIKHYTKKHPVKAGVRIPDLDKDQYFKLKLQQKPDTKEFTFKTYDTEGNELEFTESLVQRAFVTAIIQCTGVWITGNKQFGASWKVILLRVKPNQGDNAITFDSIKPDTDQLVASDDENENENENEHPNKFLQDSE